MDNQRITYKEASKNILQHIADGRYWYASQDFKSGTQFDPPALQAKKASAVLEELAAQIAKLPDPETLTKEHCGEGSSVAVKAQMMLLGIQADNKFMKSISKPLTLVEPKASEPKAIVTESNEPEMDESKLSGAEKLARAKAWTKSLL
jgi:hypothetical protein